MTIEAKVAEFIIAGYKHDRLYGRGEDYGDAVITSHIERLKETGASGYSHFEAKSGEGTWFRYCERTDCTVVLSENEVTSYLGRRTAPWQPTVPEGSGSAESVEDSSGSMNMEASVVRGLVLNVPEFFEDEAFMNWLNTRETVMTWHRRGEPAGEFSDTIVFVDPGLQGEGSDTDMPTAIWNRIVQACRDAGLGGQTEHIPVRLTNIES